MATERIRYGALCDAAQETLPKKTNSNVARSAYRMMRRAGIAWKIPSSLFSYQKPDGSFLDMSYNRPTDIVKFLIGHHPFVLSGADDALHMESVCEAFWGAYKQFHGSHKVFETHGDNLSHVIPLALHGDEGKGKRRSSTVIASLEAVVGIKGREDTCQSCQPSYLDLSVWGDCEIGDHATAKALKTNMKSHSYLQHWPLFMVPGTLNKEFKPLTLKMLELISDDLKELFTTGVEVQNQRWFVGIVGAKGDLRWHSKQARLTRGYENKSTVRDLECCHCCMAGRAGLPAEDIATESPCWLRTMWRQRPWHPQNPPALFSIPYDSSKPEMMYKHDVFHTLRLGLHRDFVGSVVFLFMRWGLFGGGRIEDKLECAHSHFKLWQIAEKKSASLRSFSKALFKYTSTKSFPWLNGKGSDVTLCLKWLSAATSGFLHQGVGDAGKKKVMEIILSCSRTAVAFFDEMNNHGLFVNAGCAAKIYELGHSYLKGYNWLANFAFQSQLCLFSIKPKAHFYRHILLELREQLQNN